MKNRFDLKIDWPTTAETAIAVQQELRHKLKITDDSSELDLIAGVDCSYDLATETSHAIIVVMERERLQPVETVRTTMPTTFPYIPGLLSFREIPVVLKALQLLQSVPDLLMVDGQGIAHPRRLGIAAHLGVLTDMPSIGVAKSRLCGRYQEPGPKKGDSSPLTDKGEMIGTVLRSKEKTNPLFISAGHRVSQATALRITLQCLTKYRLPEPTRVADKVSKIKDAIANSYLL